MVILHSTNRCSYTHVVNKLPRTITTRPWCTHMGVHGRNGAARIKRKSKNLLTIVCPYANRLSITFRSVLPFGTQVSTINGLLERLWKSLMFFNISQHRTQRRLTHRRFPPRQPLLQTRRGSTRLTAPTSTTATLLTTWCHPPHNLITLNPSPNQAM